MVEQHLVSLMRGAAPLEQLPGGFWANASGRVAAEEELDALQAC